ncbi:hypothetical protein ACH3XW_44625 [Acanthocheilonema viteae]
MREVERVSLLLFPLAQQSGYYGKFHERNGSKYIIQRNSRITQNVTMEEWMSKCPYKWLRTNMSKDMLNEQKFDINEGKRTLYFFIFFGFENFEKLQRFK